LVETLVPSFSNKKALSDNQTIMVEKDGEGATKKVTKQKNLVNKSIIVDSCPNEANQDTKR